MRLRDKVAVVVGGANGVGRATSTIFAREGARVVVADRDVSPGEECVARIRADGGEASFVATDVTIDDQVVALIATAVERYGGIDAVVYCVGVDIRGTVTDSEPARWDRVYDINVAGIYRTCREAIPHMIRRGGGAIVSIASIQGMFGLANYAAYGSSKAAVIGLSRNLATDYAQYNIRANSISPGGVATNINANTIRLEPQFAPPPSPPATSTEQRGRLFDHGQPEDIAYAALYLCSDEAAYVSGHNLVVDGGRAARLGD